MKNWIDTSFTTVTQDGQDVRVPDLGGYETDSNVQFSVMDRGDGTCLARVTTTATKMTNIEGATVTTTLNDANARSSIQATNPNADLENLDQPDIEVDAEIDAFAIGDVLDSAEQDRVAAALTARREVPRADLQALFQDHGVRGVRELVTVMSDAEVADLVADYQLSIPNHIDTSTAARAVVQVQTVGGQVLQDQEMTAMNKVARAKGLTDSDQLTKNTRADNAGDLGATAKSFLGGKNTAHDDMLSYIKGNASPPWANDVNPPAKGSQK